MSFLSIIKNVIGITPASSEGSMWDANFVVKRADMITGAVFSANISAPNREEMWKQFMDAAQEVNIALTAIAENGEVLPETYFYSHSYHDFEYQNHDGSGSTLLVENFINTILQSKHNDDANLEDKLLKRGFFTEK